MANKKNLKPFNERTESEQREIASKGGKASGKARRERKKIAEDLKILLAIVEDDGFTNQEKMVKSILKESFKGNVQAFKEIRDTIGEKPEDKTDAKITLTIKGLKKK